MSFSDSSRPPDRILAVDDTPDNLILVKAFLEDEGYDISLATDGRTALEQIEETPFDLVLLDVMMPGMDGYQVTKRIRENPALPYIPILLITAHDQSSVVEGLGAGADDFVRKPVDPDELLARVRSLLRLKHSLDEQREMTRQREDFVSRLTHDLRTPLVAADRMLNLFQQGALGDISADMNDAVGTMIRSNQNLLQMVNTLLEVYRYDAGQKALTFAPCSLWMLGQEVVEELKPLADEKGIALTLEPPQPDSPSFSRVEGDRLELRRLLTNLVGNAIKFTDAGSVTLQIMEVFAPKKDAVGQDWVVAEVQDTGTGIAAEDQARLFERFRQGKHKRSGSGLGLHLSRRIIESHRGTIDAKSELGKGSIFTIRLPKSDS